MKTRIIFYLCILILTPNCARDKKHKDYGEEAKFEIGTQTNCYEQTARIIGKLSYISNPLFVINNWSELESYVNNNRNMLLPGSEVIQCMREVGIRMQNSALQNFDPDAGGNAYESALNMGATGEMANSIRANIDGGQVQPFVMGQELVWLSQVIPKGAQGDWSEFNAGNYIRNQQIEYIRTMVVMFQSMGEAEMLNYLMATMTNYQPYIEYQTAIIVFWFF